jgi:MFS transporter, DHA2 family, multidrug resistance protein
MSSAADAKAVGRPRDADAAAWIAVAAGALGALMASLDISITNSALPQIQGEVGATGTEGTWIGTGYLMSEIVMIPLTAWLTRILGLRTLLLGCAALFLVFSMVCGLSNTLTWMIIGRFGQGFTGGAMIPTAQTIVATRLPKHQQPVGMAVFGLIVLLGPLLGPLVGGWLAENISWRWCFFINIPVGLGLAALLLLGLPREKSDLKAFARADWLGVVGLSVGLSSLTIVLEEGQRERWFESPMIVDFSIAAVVGIAVLILAQFTSRDPVVKLRLLLNPSYASVVALITGVGAVLYGVLYLLPQFLSGIAGYNAEQSGWVMLIGGLPAFLLAPVLPQLMTRLDLRLLIVIGLGLLGISCLIDTGLTADSSGGDFTLSQILRGAGQVLAMFPLNQASIGAVAPELAGDAAGLFNMARNLGGSIGLASLGALMDYRVALHSDAIRSGVSANSPVAQERVAGMSANFAAQHGDAGASQLQALRQLAGQIAQQAQVMTFADCFWLLGMLIALGLPLVALLRTPSRSGGGAMAVH